MQMQASSSSSHTAPPRMQDGDARRRESGGPLDVSISEHRPRVACLAAGEISSPGPTDRRAGLARSRTGPTPAVVDVLALHP